MTDEEFRAIIAAGPAVVMVGHMIALLDERDGLRAENARLREALKRLLDLSERYTCQHEWVAARAALAGEVKP